MAAPWLFLRISVQGGPAHSLRVPGPVCVIGRSRSAGVRLLSPEVSGAHLRLLCRDGGLWVEDLGSANGTCLQGVPLVAGKLHPVPKGASLEAGPYILSPSLAGDAPSDQDFVDGTATMAGRLLEDLIARGAAPTATIQVSSPGGVEHRCVIGPGQTLLIGRDPACDIGSTDADLSRRHAAIRQEISRAVVEDLGSKNGTWLGEMRLLGPTALRSGDRIRLGGTVLCYEDLGEIWLHELEGELQDALGKRTDSASEVLGEVASSEEDVAEDMGLTGSVEESEEGDSDGPQKKEITPGPLEGAEPAGLGEKDAGSQEAHTGARRSMETRSDHSPAGHHLASVLLVGLAVAVILGALWALFHVLS